MLHWEDSNSYEAVWAPSALDQGMIKHGENKLFKI